MSTTNTRTADFNPRPPRGGRPDRRRTLPHDLGISIHALREEGDEFDVDEESYKAIFQSTPSARRATDRVRRVAAYRQHFNPRPPRGGRRTRNAGPSSSSFYFNPRPPRGGRPTEPTAVSASLKFQSTPSARRATGRPCSTTSIPRYFNPRPPRGGRQQKRRKNPPRLFHYTHLCTI